MRNAFSLFFFSFSKLLQTSTCLASCVECLWVSNSQKTHLKESLWLYCGGYGMRVWLPVFPRDADSGYGSRHTFMSKRIMLSFALKLYPLAILFEDAIILGVENDTVVYTSDSSSHFSLPFCILERAVSRSIFCALKCSLLTISMLFPSVCNSTESSVSSSNFTSIDTKKSGLQCMGNCAELLQLAVFSAFTWAVAAWGAWRRGD